MSWLTKYFDNIFTPNAKSNEVRNSFNSRVYYSLIAGLSSIAVAAFVAQRLMVAKSRMA